QDVAALNVAANQRHASLELSQEIAFSSTELTRFARTYVVTGDVRYKNQYLQLVDIINGKAPIPDGRTIAFTELLKENGFTAKELSLLSQSSSLSMALVATEEKAFGAVEGQIPGISHEDAVKMLHDDAYHNAIEQIKAPVADVRKILSERVEAQFLEAGQKVWNSSM